jgi:hypothetical protein
MSDFFEKAAKGGGELEKEFLGPDYKYYEYINDPTALKMNSDGTFGQLATNIGGIMNYVKILVEGGGAASKTGKPLGNAFFLPTGGKCKTKDGKLVTRSIYINNIPTGKVPFMNASTGMHGLIPGVIENIGQMNPLPLFGSFMQGAEPPCTKINMPTVGQPGNNSGCAGLPGGIENCPGSDSGYVANSEIRSMDSSWFTLQSKPTLEGFIGANLNTLNNKKLKPKKYLKDDAGANLYRLSFGLFLTYLIFKMLNKR